MNQNNISILGVGVPVSDRSATSNAQIIYRAYKYRIYPNKEQRVYFAKHFGCCRFLYNHFLTLQTEAYKNETRRMSFAETCREYSQMKKDERYAWLNETNSQAGEP